MFYTGDLSSRCGFFLTCALGWVLLMNKYFYPGPERSDPAQLERPKKTTPKTPADPLIPNTQSDEPPKRPAGPVPDSIERRVEFLQSRGADVEVLPGGQIMVKSIEPVHQKLQNLVKLDGSQECFFEGCSELLKPLEAKKKEVEDSKCPSCELGPVVEDTYQSMVQHLKESGLYTELNQ